MKHDVPRIRNSIDHGHKHQAVAKTSSQLDTSRREGVWRQVILVAGANSAVIYQSGGHDTAKRWSGMCGVDAGWVWHGAQARNGKMRVNNNGEHGPSMGQAYHSTVQRDTAKF